MGLATPLGLLALLGVPVVVFLHLYRRRFRVREVAGLFLFAPDALVATAGRTRTQLLKSASLWLEIAAVVLLALWLSGPSLGAARRVAHLVVVWDDSASMGADGVSARARAALDGVLERYGSDATSTLIVTGARPAITVGPRAPIGLLRDALAAAAPRKPAHDPSPALMLGRELAGEEGRLLFLTDRLPGGGVESCEVHAVGAPAPNAAVLGARREGGKVYFDLVAFGDRPMETGFRILAADREVRRERVTLNPPRPLHLSFEDPDARLALTLRLEPDALTIDNDVTLLPEPARVVPVISLLSTEQAALLSLEEILAALPGVRRVASAGDARLVIAAASPTLAPGSFALIVQATGDETESWVGPFLLERRHPLLRGLTLEGVVWTAGNAEPPGAPIVLAGEQALVTESPVKGGGLRLHLNLDPARSNLSTSPDWPILWINLIASVRQRLPGPTVANARLGEVLIYRGAQSGLSWIDPAGDQRPARGSGVLTWETRRPGLHRIVDPNGAELARWSIHFVDAAESDLSDAATDTRAPAEPAGSGTEQRGEIERALLALLLLLALVADWWVLA